MRAYGADIVDGSAETFARKWRLFTSVSVTAPRYTTCPAVSKRSLGDAPSRAARPREAELGRQKATQPGIVSVNHSRQTATLNPAHSSSVPFCMAPLHGLSTHLRELQDFGRRYNFQRFSKYEAYLLTHTVHGGITIFSVAYVADCFALSLNVAFFEQ